MSKRNKKWGPWLWGPVLLAVIAAAVIVYWTAVPERPVQKPPERPSPAPVPTPPPPPPPVAPPGPPPRPAAGARVAIVIDDMGQDLNRLHELLRINAPITIAVLPNLAHSKETASEAHGKGRDVLLHLPMEPKDLSVNDPGKGALLMGMSATEIAAMVEEDLKTVPYAAGVNNHMGSRLTEDEAEMRAVLNVVRKKQMFFLDSRTSPASVAGRLAREIGVKNADRNVFLDNTRDTKYIKGQITELVRIARKRGTAIAIGHPYPETIEALKESVPTLNASGVEVVRLSELVN